MTGDFRKGLLFFILVLLLPAGLFSQQVRLSVSARNVKTGGHFNITVEVPGNGARVTIGGKGFKLAGEVGRGQNITIVNGRKSESITITYDAIATGEGEIVIGPASVTYNSRVLRTNSVTINSTNQGDLFMVAHPERQVVYPGEPVLINYVLYASFLGITDFTERPLTDQSQGIFRVLEDKSRKYINRSKYKGKSYYSAQLYKGLFVPVQTGEVPLPSVITQISVDAGLGNDPFGFSFFSPTEKREVTSNPGTITVKPFPEKNKPADFNGAVGDLGFDATIDRQQLKTNDAIKLRLTVAGYGNLNYINPPDITLPKAFRVYPPHIADSIQMGFPGIFGTRTFEYIALARSGGEYTIGPFRFSYFNPATEKYETIVTDSFPVSVEGRVIPEDSLDMFDQLDSAMIRSIQPDMQPARNYAENTYARWWFWFLYFFPAAALIPIFIFRHRLARLWPSKEERRRRKALGIAITALRNIPVSAAYHEQSAQLVSILEMYFAARFFPQSEKVSPAAVAHKFSISATTELKELLILWQQAESDRYSPVAAGVPMNRTRIVELLKAIDTL